MSAREGQRNGSAGYLFVPQPLPNSILLIIINIASTKIPAKYKIESKLRHVADTFIETDNYSGGWKKIIR